MESFKPIIKLISGSFRELKYGIESRLNFESFLLKYGYRIDIEDSLWNKFSNIHELVEALNKILKKADNLLDREFEINSESISDTKDLVSEIKTVLNLINALNNNNFSASPFNDKEFWRDLTEKIINDFFIDLLRNNYPVLYSFFLFVGVIDHETIAANNNRIEYTRNNIRWGNLSKIGTFQKDTYNFGLKSPGESFLWKKLNENLIRIFDANVLEFRKFQISDIDIEEVIDYQDYLDNNNVYGVQIPYFHSASFSEELFYNFGLGIIPLNKDQQSEPPNGVLIIPIIQGQVDTNYQVSSDFSLQLKAGVDANHLMYLSLFPGNTEFKQNIESSSLNLGFELLGQPYLPWNILGTNDSHHLNLSGFNLSTIVSRETSDTEIKLSLSTTSKESDTKSIQATIILNEADSFVTDATKQDKIEAGFDLEIEWSNLTGFRFGGSASLDFKFSLNKKLGSITLTNLHLGISLKNAPVERSHGPIEFRIGFGILGDFGPVKFKLENMGMAANLIPYTTEEVRQLAEPPLLGKMDLDFGFAPPKGFGFVIDAKAVKGGGYLEFRDGEYLGYAELSILNKISVKAIGIVTTVLPDGQDGYSFLLLITAEFQPIQLGLGFSLSGVGGLVGLHRDLNVGAIIAGMDNDTYKHILFPKNIIDNFDAIINSLNAIMPIRKDQYAFGIMLQLEWGTGGFITIQLGLLFSLPDFAIAVIGIVKAVIKRGDSVLVNIVFQFSVTYDDALFTFDGSLEGSKLLWWKIDGDLAVRIKGGDNRFFLMSAGGFHKKYSPPGGLKLRDPMERLSITLYEGNPHVYAEVYFAITSNTLQFGGGGYATYSKWGFGFDAALGFDALIQFSPLEFEVSVYGKVEISVFGYDFFGVELRGDVTGPYPLKITLFAKIKIGGYTKVKRVVLAPKGEEQNTALEGVSILPILIEQLEEERNWMPSIPINTPLYVTLRNYDLEVPDEEAVKPDKKYHPIGSVTISQSRVPLNIPMDHFGYRPAEDYEHFQLVADSHEAIAAHEYFAPAQFFKIEKGEEFKRKAYEKLEGGIEISGKNHFEGGTIIEKKWGYEQSYIDPEFTLAVPEPTTHEVEENQHKHFSKHTTITNSPRGRALKQYNLTKSGFGLKDTSYAVKRNDQTTPYGIKYQNIKSESEAYLMMREINEQNLDKKDRFEVVPMHEVEALTTP